MLKVVMERPGHVAESGPGREDQELTLTWRLRLPNTVLASQSAPPSPSSSLFGESSACMPLGASGARKAGEPTAGYRPQQRKGFARQGKVKLGVETQPNNPIKVGGGGN